MRRKPGQYTSQKYSREFAACHSRKPDVRRSPLVRMTRSGSGRPAVYRWAAMASGVSRSATSSRLAPARASSASSDRTAAAISARPS